MSRASRRRAVANANSPRLSVGCSHPASKADSRSPVLPMPTTAVTASSALLVALAAVAATFWLPATTAALVPFGYQTSHSANAFGPGSLGGGSTYAASAVYDPVASTLYMVGASYESSATRDSSSNSSPAAAAATDCYLTALVLPSDDPSPMSGGGILTQTLGETEISESCTAVTLLSSTFEGTYADPDEQDRTDSDERNDDRNEETAHLLLLGHTAPDGLLTELRPMGSDKSSIYGYAMDVAVTASMPAFFSSGGIEQQQQQQQQQYSGGVNFSAHLLGGRLFHEDVVVYPIAATTDNAVGSQRNDDAEEGDDVRNLAGPEFFYVLLQTSDVDPNADVIGGGHNNNFGFGQEDVEGNVGVDSGDEENWSTSQGDVVEAEKKEEEDPTIPLDGGTSLVLKKVALASTTDNFEQNPDEDQPNAMLGETMIDQWTQEFAPLDGTTVSATDLIYVPRTVKTKTATQTRLDNADVLLLTGSTRGFGAMFGQDHADGTYDTDGFVTLLDPSTGRMVDPAAPSGRNASPIFSSNRGGKSSIRIKSAFDGHDVIHGACIDSAADGDGAVYVVGSTTGMLTRPTAQATTAEDGTLQIASPTRESVLGSNPRRRAFVMKLSLDHGLKAEWVRQYESDSGRTGAEGTDVYATGCAVSKDGGVYVGGVVTNGGRLTGDGGVDRHRHVSSGGDDIFIVRVSANSGDASWARQIGSRGNDRLASRGGVLTDSDGGAILVGTTDGSFMRSRKGDANPSNMSKDAFVFSVSKLGETVTPVDPAVSSFSSFDGKCYFVNDPTLYIVILSVVSSLCAFLLGHGLRQTLGLSRIVKKYTERGREIKGTVVKRNSTRFYDCNSRHVLVRYTAPSSSGGTLIKRIDNISKSTYRNLEVGSLINIHLIPGQEKSGVALLELRASRKRLGRDLICISILLLASFSISALLATCLPWYGWFIATVPMLFSASIAWLLWRNAAVNMELQFVHGVGCVPTRSDSSVVDDCEWTDNDQTDDDSSPPSPA